MLKQRVITAVFLAVAFLAALYFLSPFHFTVLLAVVVCYGGWEWSNLAGLQSPISRFGYVALLAALITGVGLLAGLPGPVESAVIQAITLSGFLWWLIAFALVKTYPKTIPLWEPVWVRALFGLCVLVPAWSAIALLMGSPQGGWLLLLVVALVALADIGAYFTGKAFGSNKLAPNVSPGKTWEGVLGGLLANLILAVLLLQFVEFRIAPWPWVLLLIMVPAAMSVVGDLLESMLKRYRGIKDSGNILPGHGGILDRIDGLAVALPLFALILEVSGIRF